ncbi:DNA primase/helicase, phage-associated [Paenibacillus pasadenensis]|uniref:DNA primase/helicase, phage-associated n=1 Tax=Paenibacillus pasadenensis TaxID=217090 RepID=A0A2N5NCG3_9BACL|nr:bifunctional DNA primase/polymerase [Paenibacillus pasadenensis]PLT48039.1 DNA primase/helicase, phage-associated [Paenibacillus pasadenensis]
MTDITESLTLSAEMLNSMTTGAAAETMALAKLGPRYLPVCPPDHRGVSEKHELSCTRPGKCPAVKDWRIQASDDPAHINEWFRRLPNRNIGMTLGSEVGVAAFDVDGQYGREKMQELFNGDIPSTWQFSTPGGGERFLFKVPKGRTLRKFTVAKPGAVHEELAFLADNQMTVIPPSRHQNGGQYLWLPGRGPGDIHLAELPAGILRKMRQERKADASSENNEINKGMSDPDLRGLAKRCRVIREAVEEQVASGCAEDRWHAITSMLVRAGFPNTALAFSKMSKKHDGHSERRIRQMESEGDSAAYGPTRCSTFGCGADQMVSCHGKIRRNRRTGELSNSPAAFLQSRDKGVVSAKQTGLDAYSKLLASRYSINGGNLCQVRANKDGGLDHVPLANFVARIAKTITRDDGAERTALYEIDGAIISPEKKLPPIRVLASDFDCMKWTTSWGPEPNILPGSQMKDTVRHAIQSTATGAANERIFAHLGWIQIDGVWRYLHSGGALGLSNIKVELDDRLQNYVLPASCGHSKKAMQASLKLLELAPHRVTLVLWSLVFLAPMCELLRQMHLEPKFLVWLSGHTGTRKTSLALLFLSHFGDLLGSPPASFKDTANAVEKRTFDTKDSLLLIDDFHPTASPKDKKDMETVAHKILRGYGDRVARGRMKQDTTLRKDYIPRGVALATAEDMVSGGSSTARLFPAELQKADVDLDKLTEAQREAPRLSEAMSGYLQWLGKAMNAPLDSSLKELFLEKRNEAGSLGVHGRLVDASALLYIGLRSGLGYAESVGAITVDRKSQLLETAWNVFLNAASEQGEKVAEVKPSTQFTTIVSQLLANRSIHCDHVRREPVPESVPKSSTLMGWQDDKYYYFLPDPIYNEISQFLSKRGEQFPVSAATLWKELANAGITKTENGKENGKERRHSLAKKVIKGQRQRLLWVRVDALHEKAKDKTGNNTRAELRTGNAEPDELELLGEL